MDSTSLSTESEPSSESSDDAHYRRLQHAQYLTADCQCYIEQFVPLPMLVSSRTKILDTGDFEPHHHRHTPPHEHHYEAKGPNNKKRHSPLTLDECLDRGEMPDFDTLTRTYVQDLFYKEALEWIRDELAGEKLFLTFSTAPGTLSYSHVSFVNVIIGTLSASQARDKIYLINCRQIFTKDNDDQESEQEEEFYVQLFHDSMKLLWPDEESARMEDILLLVTEPKRGMLKSVDLIRLSCPYLIHVTCLDATLHHLETLIGEPSKEVVGCIDYQEVFIGLLHSFHQHVKRRGRANFQLTTDLPLPPLPDPDYNMMDWVYYVQKHYRALKLYFANLHDYRDNKNDEFIRNLLLNSDVDRKLAILKAKYYSLGVARKTLQEDLSLIRTVSAVEDFRARLSKWPEKFEQILSDKFRDILDRNEGYQVMRRIADNLKLCTTSNPPTHLAELDESEHSIDCKLFHRAPIVALNRAGCFPRFEQLLRLYPEAQIPPQHMHIYSVIYCKQEASTNRADDQVYHELDCRQFLVDLDPLN